MHLDVLGTHAWNSHFYLYLSHYYKEGLLVSPAHMFFCEVLWGHLDYALDGDYLDVDEDDLVIDCVRTNFRKHVGRDSTLHEEAGTDKCIYDCVDDDCDTIVAVVAAVAAAVVVVVGSMSVDHEEEDCYYGYCCCCCYLQDYHCGLVALEEEDCTKKRMLFLWVVRDDSLIEV